MQAGQTPMDYELAEHRYALAAAGREDLKADFDELLGVIHDISEEDIISRFNNDAHVVAESEEGVLTKSLSDAINTLLALAFASFCLLVSAQVVIRQLLAFGNRSG